MARVTGSFECKLCHHMVRFRDRYEHGKYAPICLMYRSWDWMHENEYRPAGRDAAVLSMAGVVRQLPTASRHYPPVVVFYAAAPSWAVKLARCLVEDQAMIQRLKIGRKQRREGYQGIRRRTAEGLPPDYILLIPIEVRAQIISVAANNALINAMITDDVGGLETAIILARDQHKKVGIG